MKILQLLPPKWQLLAEWAPMACDARNRAAKKKCARESDAANNITQKARYKNKTGREARSCPVCLARGVPERADPKAMTRGGTRGHR